MKIGLIDVDGHNFPNLPIMKISAYHKSMGDEVVWYNPLLTNHCDRVYMSKVFTFTPDFQYYINATEVVKGGTGYHYPDGGPNLPDEIEHIYPDYSIYDNLKKTENTAYGFLTRGCPRGCDFCIVGKKEGKRSVKVADLSEFWHGQKNIVLLDPNLFACADWKDLSEQLIDSRSWIDFSQGCDIRMMSEEKAEYIKQMKIKRIHFAWDKYEEKDLILPKFRKFKETTGWDHHKMSVYVLTNFNTSHEQDLERIYTLREIGYQPYVMIYDKDKLPRGHITRRLQRWCNMKAIFESGIRFEEYKQWKSK